MGRSSTTTGGRALTRPFAGPLAEVARKPWPEDFWRLPLHSPQRAVAEVWRGEGPMAAPRLGFRGPEHERRTPMSADGTRPPAPVEFRYTQTDSFVAVLRELGAALLVSTYQANKLLAVRAAGPGVSTLVRTFDRPMGIAVDGRRVALG